MKEPVVIGTKHEPPRGFGDILFEHEGAQSEGKAAKKSKSSNKDDTVSAPQYGRVRIDRVKKMPCHADLDENLVSDIAETIIITGIINPIVVRRIAGSNKVDLIAGAHRLEGARHADENTSLAHILRVTTKKPGSCNSLRICFARILLSCGGQSISLSSST